MNPEPDNEKQNDATRVSFYILKSDSAADGRGRGSGSGHGRMRVACRLAETAYRRGHRVYIHTRSPAEANALDQLLWTFSELSFVPHSTTARLANELTEDQNDCPVTIGIDPPDASHRDVLIPLLDEIPDYFTRFARVMEAVDTEETEKRNARQRFSRYRARGIEPESHEISA